MKLSKRITTALALMLMLGAGACLDEEAADPITAPEFGFLDSHRSTPRAFRVYTQNMFLGGDTGPLFTADLSDLEALAQATFMFYSEVQNSDIPARVGEFVDEMQRRRPHVVALQEVVRYTEGFLVPTETGLAFTQPTPGPDLLASLEQELADRHLPYDAVVHTTTSLTLPRGAATANGIPALNVQDRVVMLVHEALGEYETASGSYPVTLRLAEGFEVVRGWVRVTVDGRGEPVHFVGTHLETQGSADPNDPQYPVRQVHNAQADHLQNVVLAGLEGDVVLMGDLNSDAAADPSQRSWTPTYGNFVDGGYVDVWEDGLHLPRDEGFTCCLEEGRVLEERIDFVLLRTADSHDQGGYDDDDHRHDRLFNHRARRHLRANVIGDRPKDQTASGQWPSDHAGIVATIGRPISRRSWR